MPGLLLALARVRSPPVIVSISWAATKEYKGNERTAGHCSAWGEGLSRDRRSLARGFRHAASLRC